MMNPLRLLVPIDFSDITKILIDYSASLASKFGSEVHIVHSNESFMAPVSAESFGFEQVAIQDVLMDIDTRLEEKIHEVVTGLKQEGFQATGKLLSGRAHLKISEYAKEMQCDLIIIGTHGHSGLQHLVLGSTTERLIRVTHVPVLSIKSTCEPHISGFKNICVPLDLSPDALKVIPLAIKWARYFGSVVHFVHVDALGMYLNEERDLEPELDSLFPELYGIEFKKVILASESVVPSILDYSAKNQIDCLMQTSHGAGKLTSVVLGSKAYELVMKSERPVLTVNVRDH